MIGHAREAAEAAGVEVDWRCADMCDLPPEERLRRCLLFR